MITLTVIGTNLDHVLKQTDLVQTREEAEVQAIQVGVRRKNYHLVGVVEKTVVGRKYYYALFRCPAEVDK